MMTEDRLRELLRDPGWSLPAWPDAQARVRRAARRQRMAVARLGAAVTAVVTTAAVVPVLLLSRGPAADYSATASMGPAFSNLPGEGMAAFTTSIYPAAVPARVTTSWLPLCPSPAGLQAQPQNVAMAVASQAVLRQLAVPPVTSVTVIQQRAGMAAALAARSQRQAFASDLSVTDRAFWPRLASGDGITEVIEATQARVLYSGPLRSYPQVSGSPDLASVVTAGCGGQVARDTWVIVSGHSASPTRAAETLFVRRSGRVLLYSVTSRAA